MTDLNPQELAQLKALMTPAYQVPDEAWKPWPTPSMEEEESEAVPAMPSLPPEALAANIATAGILNLTSGEGLWKGHSFTLTEEQLKRVHKVAAQCIAAQLRAEIERLDA